MTIEHTPAATAVLENELESTATAPVTVNAPEPKDPFPTPTAEQVKENGLYYYFLPEQERVFYKAARESEGLKDAIALMEIKIVEIQYYSPENVALFIRAMSLLDRLVKTHYRIFGVKSEAKSAAAVKQMPQQFSSAPGIHLSRKMRRDLARKQH